MKISFLTENFYKDKLLKRRHKAFTLAEILLTLVIIGTVAALTIPALIQNTQNAQYVAALKKSYAILGQAQTMLFADNMDMVSLFSQNTDPGNAMNVFAAKLNVATNCGDTGVGCFPNSNYTYLNGALWINFAFVNGCGNIVLADGSILALSPMSSTCNVNEGNGALVNTCGSFAIDVNGAKPPNQMGRDVFLFWVTKTSIVPFGAPGDGFYCNPNGGSLPYTQGHGCAQNILTNGAMNY